MVIISQTLLSSNKNCKNKKISLKTTVPLNCTPIKTISKHDKRNFIVVEFCLLTIELLSIIILHYRSVWVGSQLSGSFPNIELMIFD